MLYSELIAEIADRTNLKKANAKAAVDTMVEIITECAKKGEDVAVNKLGTFRSKMVPEREGHNPATGEKVTVAAHKALRLQVSTALKRQLTNAQAGFGVRHHRTGFPDRVHDFRGSPCACDRTGQLRGEFDHYIYSEASGLHHRRNRHRIHRNGDDAEANKLGGIPALSGCSAVGSAHALGAWGRGFESHHSGQHQ